MEKTLSATGTNYAERKDVTLKYPTEFFGNRATEDHFFDYIKEKETPEKAKLHLTCFLTCLENNKNYGVNEFKGIYTCISAFQYPVSITSLVIVGLWGTMTATYNIEFRLIINGKSETVHVESVYIEYPQEGFDIKSSITLNIPSPGPVFFDCYYDNQIIGRRALFFKEITDVPPTNEREKVQFMDDQIKAALEEMYACSDPLIEESKKSEVVYFSICEKCIDVNQYLKLEGQIQAVFWKSYPLQLSICIASAFRMPKGNNNVRVDLVSALTGAKTPITTKDVEVTSSFKVYSIIGELIALVPEPGLYYINAYINDHRIVSLLIPMETEKPQWSYKLRDSDIKRVLNGELVILLNGAEQES